MGTIGTLDEHVATCNFALLPCPNECKDKSEKVRYFLKKDLSTHADLECPKRKYTCEDCGLEDTYSFITESHHEDCPMVILPCPKRPCTEMLQRQYLERHIETECKHAVVCYKYKGLGCEREMKREDMAAHEEDDKLHLHMAIDMTAQLSSEIATLEAAKAKLFNRISTLEYNRHSVVTFKVPEFRTLIKHSRFITKQFYTSLNGCLMGIFIHANGLDEGKGTHVSIDVALDDGDYDDEISWPFKADVTVTLLNQLEDDNHFTKTITVIFDRERHSEKFSFFPAHCETDIPAFIPHSQLGATTHNGKVAQYIVKDTLYFRVTVKERNNWLKCTLLD